MTARSTDVKRADAKSYDTTATEFGVLTDLYSKRIAERMLDLAAVTAGDRLLDVGTGTGLLARMAAARGADAVGIDHSTGMLGQAQASADKDGVGQPHTVPRDGRRSARVRRSELRCNGLAIVLRHLPNPHLAAREMYRTLRPGGRLITSIGARPNPFSPTSFASAVGAAADRVQGVLGRRVVAPQSLRDFLRQQGLNLGHEHAAHSHLGDLAEMLRSIGFTSVRQEWWGERHSVSPKNSGTFNRCSTATAAAH